jgi:hypothetical protein
MKFRIFVLSASERIEWGKRKPKSGERREARAAKRGDESGNVNA